VDALCEAVGREPANADAYHVLGMSCSTSACSNQAVAASTRRRELQPDYPDIGASLMKALRLRGGLSPKELARRASSNPDVRDRVGKLSAIAAAASATGK